MLALSAGWIQAHAALPAESPRRLMSFHGRSAKHRQPQVFLLRRSRQRLPPVLPLMCRNTAVEGLEDFVVVAACFSEAQGFYAFDTDFRRVRRRFEDLHRFRDEFLQRHGVRVLCLAGAHKLGLNVWWN